MDVMTHSSTFLLPAIPAAAGRDLTYALVLLNQHLPRFTPLLWNHAQFHVCADGGANRLYDELPQILPHKDASSVRNRYKPDLIKGDMDSIRAEVLDFYRNLGTKIVDESHDQDTTDLHKCVAFVRDFKPLEESNVLVGMRYEQIPTSSHRAPCLIYGPMPAIISCLHFMSFIYRVQVLPSYAFLSLEHLVEDLTMRLEI